MDLSIKQRGISRSCSTPVSPVDGLILVQVAMMSIAFAESFNPRLAAVPSLCRSSSGIRGLPQSISANSLSAQPARPVHSLAVDAPGRGKIDPKEGSKISIFS
jgi:hypothetical protein